MPTIMTRHIALLLVVFSACLQPVVQVGDCSGQCPRGECDDGCAEKATAGCDTPQACLEAYACSRGGSCAEYRDGSLDLADRTSACENTTGVYCAGILTTEGKRRSFAVDCRNGTLSVAPCNSPGDGGTRPQACRGVCRVSYNVE
jgi:hypothetical protein